MARTMNLDPDAQLFRAKILKKYRYGGPFVSYEGPYTTAAAAQARVTYWANYLGRPEDEMPEGTWAEGCVEAGTVTWAKLGS